MARPFPALALLTIYEHAASDALYWNTPQLESITPARKQRLLGTVIGMAHFATMLTEEQGPTVKSVHSAKQRMLWIQPEPDYFIHAVRTSYDPTTTSHSLSDTQTIDLPTIRKSTSTKNPTNSRLEDDSLLASLSNAYAQYYLLHGKMSVTQGSLGRTGLADQLQRFWSEWVTNWRLESSETGQKPFQRIVGGLTRSSLDLSQVKPLLDQFAASNSSATPLLLHRNAILYLPPLKSPSSTRSSSIRARTASEVSESDVEAIVEYLAALSSSRVVSRDVLPISTPTTTIPSSPIKRTSSPSKPPSTWRSVKHGLSYLIPPIPATMSLPDILFNSPEATVAERGSTLARSSRAELADSLMKSMKEDASGEVIERRGNTVSRKRGGEGAGGWTGGLRGINWSSGLSAIGVGGAIAEGQSTSDQASKSPTIPTPPPLSPFTAEFPSSTVAPPVVVPPIISASQSDTATSDIVAATQSPISPVSPLSTTVSQDPGSTPNASTLDEQPEQPINQFDNAVEIHLGQGPHGPHVDSTARLRVMFSGDLTLALIVASTAAENTIDRSDNTLLSDASNSDEQEWLLKKSNRLLEAVLAILDVSPDAPATKDDTRYPHRYVVRTGLFTDTTNSASLTTSIPASLTSSQPKSTTSSKRPNSTGASTGDDWSGKENDDETDINGALVAAVTSMRSFPHILESCTRTNTSHWVLSRKLDDLAHTTPSISTEVYLVLPPKVGKEGSIIDAEEEMRVLERRLRSQAS